MALDVGVLYRCARVRGMTLDHYPQDPDGLLVTVTAAKAVANTLYVLVNNATILVFGRPLT